MLLLFVERLFRNYIPVFAMHCHLLKKNDSVSLQFAVYYAVAFTVPLKVDITKTLDVLFVESGL